jgi:hypothetical protein
MQAKKEHETFGKHPFILKINVTFRTNKHKKYVAALKSLMLTLEDDTFDLVNMETIENASIAWKNPWTSMNQQAK